MSTDRYVVTITSAPVKLRLTVDDSHKALGAKRTELILPVIGHRTAKGVATWDITQKENEPC